jgi:hypothetical protein
VLSGADGLSSLAASVSTAAKLLEDQIDVVIANGGPVLHRLPPCRISQN